MNRFCVNCMAPLETDEICPSCGFCQTDYHAEAHQLAPGTLLRDRYQIGRVLGEGGFGITYVGEDVVLERKVAVKEFYMSGYVNRNCTVSTDVLSGTGTQGDTFEKNKEKFLTEARVLAKFDDEGIVNIRDFFQENNTAYIVMDFLSGETLRDYIKRIGKLTTEEIVSILEPVFQALTNVHNHDLIHRDISPDNIMLTDDGKVKLLDFGAAREVSKADAKSLSIILKPGYAPEEQYRSKGRQGPWTDVYALCATMYRCITGIVPEDAMDRIFGDSVIPPVRLDCGCSKAMSYVIMKGLSVRAVDRFQNIPELWDAICMAEENPDYVPQTESEDERTVYVGAAPAASQEDESTVYAGAAAADPDATVYSGHVQPQRAAEAASRRNAAAPVQTAARSERFQRQTTTTSRRPAAPVRQAAPQPEQQAEPEKPVQKKKSRLPLIAGIAACVLAVVGLGFFFGKNGGLKGRQVPGQTQQYQEILPEMDREEMTSLLGGAIDLISDEISISLPVKVDDMVAQGYTLAAAGRGTLPRTLAAKEVCEAVLVSPDGIPGKIIYTVQNFLTEPAVPEKCVIVGLSSGGPAEQPGLTVSCETPAGVLQLSESTDFEALEAVVAELGLTWEQHGKQSAWRVYLDPEKTGAYLDLGFDASGSLASISIDTGHAVEEYYEAHPPVKTPAAQPAATESVVTGMPYRREALVEQMGGDMELYWNGHTMRLPASVLELKEQGFPLDNWSGEPMPQSIAAGIQKTAMIDNETSDSGYMYIGVHNYTSTEQPVDGCWIADVEIFGVPNYRDLQLNWWTPGGQFYIYSGMTSDEIRQEAANNNVCIMPDEAINSDWPEDMMLSVAEDGSLVQLALFFDENGTLCDMAILMGHVYERYFEQHPEEAVPQTATVVGGSSLNYDRNAMIESIGGEIIVTHDGITTPFPISLGEMKAMGYGTADFEHPLPEIMDPNSWRDFRISRPSDGYAPMTQYALENFTDQAISSDACMLTDALFSPWGDIADMELVWKTARGELRAVPGMYLEDVEAQMGAAGLRWVPNDIESDQHTVRMMSMGVDERYANVIFFFIPETEELDGIHVSIGGSMRSYFKMYPEQALPVAEPVADEVLDRDALIAYMGGDVLLTWDNGSCALPMSFGEFLTQGYPVSEWAGYGMATPETIASHNSMTACIWRDPYAAGSGNGNVDLCVENYADINLKPEDCMISHLSIWDVHNYKNVCLTWNTPNGIFKITQDMSEQEILAHALELRLQVHYDVVDNSEHSTMGFVTGNESSVEIVTFFEPDGSFHGIHIFNLNPLQKYFDENPGHTVPVSAGPDYRVEEVRAAMGIEINAAWDGYNVTLPMPVADYLAQGHQMQSMKFGEYANPFEGFNAIFQNSAGMETSMMYWLSNFTNGQLLQEHCLITEVQTSIERSTENLVFTVKFPTGTMTLAAGMTKEQVDAEMERFGLVYTTFPNDSVKKMELLSTEGRAFIDIDFDENGVVKYLRACVDTYCAEYYGIHGLS